MNEIVIRPTMKFIKAGYCVVALGLIVSLALESMYGESLLKGLPRGAISAVFVVLFLWPAMRHVRRQFTKVSIGGDRLRYETGLLSRSIRTIQLSKVQDVRVDQALGQRMSGVGNLSIETAGESSRLTVRNIDRPVAVADQIMDAVHKGGAQGQNP